jgi:AraC-like DNA-binding protein
MAGEPHRSRALPRGAATIIIDVSGREHVDFFTGDGCARLDVPSAFIAGAGTASYITGIDAAQTVMTVHFKPAGAVAFLDGGMAGLENACVGLGEVWGRPAVVLHEQLQAASSAAGHIALIELFLLSRRRSRDRNPSAEIASVLRSVESDPAVRISQVRAALGWSPRRLTERFRAEVGLAPKAYQRVRRLQGALHRLDGDTHRGADIAAELGYFDQAHFVRDFREFTGMTPTEYADRRSWLPGHVDLGQKYPIHAGSIARG